MKRARSLSTLILLLLSVPLGAYAQTGGAVINAASCQQADVNSVINGPTHTAVNGDTINIPAGSCTWTTGIVVPSGIGIAIIGDGTQNSGGGSTGPGTQNTTIIDNVAPASGYLFKFQPTYGSATTRISTLNLVPLSGASLSAPIAVAGTCTASGCPNLRVDNLTFPASWQNASLPANSIILAANLFGVADHNSVTGSGGVGLYLINADQPTWLGVGQYGDNSWATSDTFGTVRAFYVENNSFSTANATESDEGISGNQSSGGARVVCRFNTFNPVATSATSCGGHGTSTSGRSRGVRQMEAYNNTLVCSGSCDSAIGINSGTALIFNNTWSASSGGFNAYSTLSVQRAFYGPFAPWGSCDGTGGYDQNDGTVYAFGSITTGATGAFSDSSKSWTANQLAGSAVTNGTPYSVHDVTQGFGDEISSNTATQYTFPTAPIAGGGARAWTWNVGDSYQILRATVCVDQPGRGQGNLLSGATPTTGWVSDVLDPVYEWGDTQTGGFGVPIKVSGSNRVIANRDWYNEKTNQTAQTSPTSPFSGTSGTGHGTLANRPTTCATGVAYWATDQGNWNQSGSGGQGELYICTATNTWTMTYEPYTYPHPLITAGTSGTPVVPNPPTKVTATVQSN
jgi:hypothetical protein